MCIYELGYLGAPRHAMLGRCVQRVSEMLDENLAIGSKVKAATFLLAYCNVSGELSRGHTLVQRIAPLLASQDISPLDSLWWNLRLGHFHCMTGNLEASGAALTRARDVAHRYGISGLLAGMLLLYSYESYDACLRGDAETVRRLINETDTIAVPSRPMDNCHVAHTRAYLATLLGDAKGMSRWGRDSVEAARQAGLPYTEAINLLYETHGLAILGNIERVRALLISLRDLIDGTYMAYFESEARFLLAFCELREPLGRDFTALITDALCHARDRHYHYPHMSRFSIVLSEVLGASLRAGIEVEYVREVIRRYRIRNRDADMIEWPWPIRIFVLGRFEVQRDDLPLRFAGKTPRKPLALLKALVAFGGVDVPQARLIDALWPDDEGDAGKQAFSVTLVRLRKLLGQHEAIVLADERVSLNRALCWVDAFAFEARGRKLDAERGAQDLNVLTPQWEETLALYQGVLLPTDMDALWTTSLRLRLRGLFTALIEDLASHYEQAGVWRKAIDSYRRGLEADDIIEGLYLGLMRCHLALKQPAEGLSVYRRLRQILSVALGVGPSAASDAMSRALQDCGQAHMKELPPTQFVDR